MKNYHVIVLFLGVGLLQACTQIGFVKPSRWEKSSLISYQMNEDDEAKSFKLPVMDAPKEYRMLLDGHEIEASEEQIFMNGKLLKFDKRTGEFTYRPLPNYNGAQVIEFEIQDAMSGSWSHYAADLIVNPVNDAPTAQDATVNPIKQKPLLVPVEAFKPEDIDGFANLQLSLLDQDNKAVTELKRDATRLRVVEDGKKIEVVVDAFTGAMSFTIRISDGSPSIGNNHIDVNLVVSPENPLLDFKPALAVNKTQCLQCHAQIAGNFLTSMGMVDGKKDISFLNTGSKVTAAAFGEYAYGNWTDHGAKAFTLSSFINGTIYLPHGPLDEAAKTRSKAIFSEAIQQVSLNSSSTLQIMDFTGVEARTGLNLMEPQTGGQYLYATNNLRTAEYLSFLKNYGAGKTLTPKANIKEVASLSIKSPSETTIKARIRINETMSFYPQDLNLAKLENFSPKKARLIDGVQKYIWGNDPQQVMKCNGDIFVDGPVYLENLKLDTRSGCRIHATGTIFVSGNLRADGESATTPRHGYLLMNPSTQSSLELTSSAAILLGLGFSEKIAEKDDKGVLTGRMIHPNFFITNRLTHPSALQPTARVLEETKLLVSEDNTADDPSLMLDASKTNRAVTFDHLLLNAPLIHSRYTGDFRGVVIADFVLWSLGKFKYFYDDVFDRVPIFPMLESNSFFEVKLCETSKTTKRDDQFSECQP